MIISVISDSHDHIQNLKKAVEISNERGAEYLLHLGDIIAPYSAKILADFSGIVHAVFGNNDGEKNGLARVFNQFGGTIENPPYKLSIKDKKMALMHEPYILDDLVASKHYDYIFYGHLHEADLNQINSCYTLNPGELCGWSHRPSFYLINLGQNHFEQIDL